MKLYKYIAICFLIGWFVLGWPIIYAIDGDLFGGLLNGVIGLLTTVAILWFGEKWEAVNGEI